MKDIPAHILNLLNSNNPQYTIQVLLNVAYWNGQTGAASRIEHRETPVDITSMILRYGKFSYKLDTTEFDKWEASSGSLTVDNKRGEWNEGTANSFFQQHEYLYKSKITVKFGTPTFMTNIFTGYLSQSPNFNNEEQTCDLRIFSEMDMLETFNAERVNQFGNHFFPNPTNWRNATNSGDNLNFTTDLNTVGIIGTVALYSTAAGTYTELLPSKDYSISNLNLASTPATITLKNPLNPGFSVKWRGIQWYVDKDFDFLVNELLNLANVKDRDVQPVVFQNDAKAYLTNISDLLNNATMWHLRPNASGTGTTTPNYAFISTPQYALTNHSQIDGRYTNIQYDSAAYNIKTNNGTYSMTYTPFGAFPGSMSVGVFNNRFETLQGNGYGFSFYSSNGNNLDWYFQRITGGFYGTGATLLSGRVSGNMNHEFIFSIKDGVINVFVDNIKIGSVYDSTYNNFKFFSGGGTGNDVYSGNGTLISNIKFSEMVMTEYSQYSDVFSEARTFQKPKMNLHISSVNPNMTMWDTIHFIENNPQNVPTLYWLRKSFDRASWTAWQRYFDNEAIAFEGDYLEFMISYDSLSISRTVELTQLDISYLVRSGITINVANFTGLNVLEAIEQMAAMCSYEIGFNSDGAFFFRKREINSVAGELTKNEVKRTALAEIDFANLKTRVSVKFGKYERNIDGRNVEPHPNLMDIYGERTKAISSENLLPADNVDLAFAIAPTVYANVSKLKRRIKIRTRFLLQAELGDSFLVKYLPNDKRFETMTEADKIQASFTYNRIYRVQGMDIDLNNKELTLDMKSEENSNE